MFFLFQINIEVNIEPNLHLFFFFSTVNYSIIAPKTVEQTATEFKKNLKKKIKPKPFIKLKNVKKEKPEKAEKASDLYLVFSPVVSRTGTDISAALKNIESKIFFLRIYYI